MEVSTFNDKRILTMLNQSYNFDYILVADLANEAMKRKLISVMPIIILIGSFIIYLLTDWILIFGLGTLTAGGTYLSKRRFKS